MHFDPLEKTSTSVVHRGVEIIWAMFDISGDKLKYRQDIDDILIIFE